MTERQVLDYLQLSGAYLEEKENTVLLHHENVQFHIGHETFERMKAKAFLQNNGNDKWTLTAETVALLHTSRMKEAKFRVKTAWVIYPAIIIILFFFIVGILCLNDVEFACKIMGQ